MDTSNLAAIHPKPNKTTHEGWKAFVETPLPVPVAAEPETTLNKDERVDYQMRRIAYHAQLQTVKTKQMDKIITRAKKIVRDAQFRNDSPRGMALSGPPTIGKSTILQHLGRQIHQSMAEKQPHRQHPVVYVSLPARPSSKELLTTFLRFYGVDDLYRGKSATDMLHLLQDTARKAGTAVILIDEAQLLEWGRQHAMDAPSHLKSIADATGIPIVLAGVELGNSSLFIGRNSRQIRARHEIVELQPFHRGTSTMIAQWIDVINNFEKALRLKKHKPGTLAKFEDYLFDRTGGLLGGLNALICRAAVDAIDTGEERITKKLLSTIEIPEVETTRKPRLAVPA